jgi:hypothetical protein
MKEIKQPEKEKKFIFLTVFNQIINKNRYSLRAELAINRIILEKWERGWINLIYFCFRAVSKDQLFPQ